MDTYEVLVVKNGTYNIRYYPLGKESKGIDLELDEWDFENFIVGKKEV